MFKQETSKMILINLWILCNLQVSGLAQSQSSVTLDNFDPINTTRTPGRSFSSLSSSSSAAPIFSSSSASSPSSNSSSSSSSLSSPSSPPVSNPISKLGLVLRTTKSSSLLITSSESNLAPPESTIDKNLQSPGSRRSSGVKPASSSCLLKDMESRFECGEGAEYPEIRRTLIKLPNLPNHIHISECNIKKLGKLVDISTSDIQQVTLVSSKLSEMTTDSLNSLSPGLLLLDLSGNQLNSFPSAVSGLSKLTSLDLSRNRIQDIHPHLLLNLTRLVSLNLADNRLYTGSGDRNVDLHHLKDRLDFLSLSGNDLEIWPDTLNQPWRRLRNLEISRNRISSVPRSMLKTLPALQSLIIEENKLQNIFLEDEEKGLLYLSLLGNPLHCDCKAVWLLDALVSSRTRILAPSCSTPFRRKDTALQTYSGKGLCNLENNKTLEFYRVNNMDAIYFPRDTFSTLRIHSVHGEPNLLDVQYSIDLEFYYKEYDWGIVYRKLGVEGTKSDSSSFIKTGYNLRDYASKHEDWVPGYQMLHATISTQYSPVHEVCLAVLEQDTAYYLHQDLCRVVYTGYSSSIKHNLVAEFRDNSLSISWEPEKAVRILIREFGSQNSTVYSVPKPELRENRSVYSIQENLEHGVGYSVCIQDLRYGNQYPDTPGDCAEVRTEPGGFSVGEVATATAVSSTTTLAVVFLVCCCCPSWRKCGKSASLDVNENLKESSNRNEEVEPKYSSNRDGTDIKEEPDQGLENCASCQSACPTEDPCTRQKKSSIRYVDGITDYAQIYFSEDSRKTATLRSGVSLSSKYSDTPKPKLRSIAASKGCLDDRRLSIQEENFNRFQQETTPRSILSEGERAPRSILCEGERAPRSILCEGERASRSILSESLRGQKSILSDLERGPRSLVPELERGPRSLIPELEKGPRSLVSDLERCSRSSIPDLDRIPRSVFCEREDRRSSLVPRGIQKSVLGEDEHCPGIQGIQGEEIQFALGPRSNRDSYRTGREKEKRKKKNGNYHTVSYRQFYKTALPVLHYTPYTTQLRRTNSMGASSHHIYNLYRESDVYSRPLYPNPILYNSTAPGSEWRETNNMKF